MFDRSSCTPGEGKPRASKPDQRGADKIFHRLLTGDCERSDHRCTGGTGRVPSPLLQRFSTLLRKAWTNESYYLLNLPAEFQTEGAKVRVEGLLIRDYQIFLHPPVEIRSIRLRNS